MSIVLISLHGFNLLQHLSTSHSKFLLRAMPYYCKYKVQLQSGVFTHFDNFLKCCQQMKSNILTHLEK